MGRFWLAALFLMAAPVFAASEGTLLQLQGKSMGTTWSAKMIPPREVSAEQLNRSIQAALDSVVAQMSTWQEDSDISRWNQAAAGWWPIPDDFFEVLRHAMTLAEETQGAYDPTVGPLTQLWGFGPQGPRPRIPSDAELDQVRARVGWRRVALDPATSRVRQPGGVSLDLSSIAKGYGVDRVAAALEALGVTSYLMELGGELRGKGQRPDGKPWRVGIEQPLTEGVQDSVAIPAEGMSVATSGNYRRSFHEANKRYTHIIDPRSGRPVEHSLASVTVLHTACMQADAWATALFVLGPTEGLAYARRKGLAALFIVETDDGFLQQSTPAYIALLESS